MPTFKLNKLVRDKLKGIYEGMDQKPTYKKLSDIDHKTSLRDKIIEEASELDVSDEQSRIIDEVADLRQILDDLVKLCDITEDQVKLAQKIKYDKKGGFIEGVFVDTIELADDDEWVEYYRKQPDITPEL
ncbi:MAG: nucleoside triphosphate pyrophosphohydrolase [Candidatus Saccharibacteria bacterium]